MEEELKPNYFAIIPAIIRYDKALTDKEKLLYGEITALSNKEGYCFAGNSYFATLYGVAAETISRAITKLIKRNYLKREIKYKNGSKEIEKRLLYPLTNLSIGIDENFPTPIDENVKDNNTSESTSHNISFTYMNNIKENKKHTKKEKEFIPPTVEEVKKYAEERNSIVDAEYFVDYYAANDWKDSKGNKVKNWKQKFITWDKRDKNSSQIRASVNYVDNPNDWSEGKEIFEEYYRQQEEESRKGK